MTVPVPSAQERRRATFLVRWALVNLFLTAAASGLTLWIWMTEQSVRGQIARVRQREQQGCEQRVIKSATPQIIDAEPEAPAHDAPRPGYFGPRGTGISPTMRLTFEALRDRTPAGKFDSLRLGSKDVLPPGTIHVVNLWATWCAPCKAEMPDFKALFERHRGEWGDSVRFVPILVKDPGDPRKAYQDFGAIMPPAPVKLADRSYEDSFVTTLAADEQRKLFHGQLPVTFVLDCNRRVRWARFAELTEEDLVDLEKYLEVFRAELADTSEGSWCTKVWAGNGRCEGNENTPAHHSLEDCGELKRRPGLPTLDASLPPVEAPSECAANMQRNADGRCVPKLKGDTRPVKPVVETAADKRCGDGKCEPRRGESNQTCCQDCACNAPLVCRPDTHDEYRCQVKGLK